MVGRESVGRQALFPPPRADDTTGRAIRKIMRADLICIDDIGLLPVTTETAEALHRVVDASYELARRRLMEGRWRGAEAVNKTQASSSFTELCENRSPLTC